MTSKRGYHNKAGDRIPANTTILNQLGWKSRGLMHWSWKMGMEGKDYREVADEEADIGTIAHKWVEADLHGKDRIKVDIPMDSLAKLDKCMASFNRWSHGSRLDVTGSEIEVISEKHQYGTRIDHPARIDGTRIILELKSTTDLYEDHLIQVAAQWQAWDEEFPGDPVQEAHILRLGKEDASFHHHSWIDLAKYFRVFVLCRELYDLQKQCRL